MLETKKIEYKGNINKIYHIADVHIRNLKRHKEYREVFDRLYKYISDTKTDESIIVLVGDIVHAKTDMTPEVVEMTQIFLKRLSDLLPTILIPGNHDANLNNPSRMDALTPIVNAINHENLHYLRNSGVWEMGGKSFVHTSVFGDSKNIISSDDVSGDYKIALYHGPVDGVKTEHGFQIQNKNVNVGDFNGYDLVLLGDIHVPNQSLNDDGTIKYCGSTIMQNHTESQYKEHGILVWDLDTKKSEFVPIRNDYGYVTLDIDNGKIVGNVDIPIKPRVRIRVNNTSKSDLDKILVKIKSKRKLQELSIQNVLNNNKSDSKNKSISIQNVDDVGFQNKLISDLLKTTSILNDDEIGIVTSINTDINDRITNKSNSKNVIWKPKRFEFSNMFSYGDDNVIDFDNLNGTYGIFAPNASGKSSLWDALSFCIFDKCSRTSKAIDVLNNLKTEFTCKFNFEIDGTNYYIERSGKKSPKRGTVKVNVNFYTTTENGIKSLNGEERRETNSIIRQYVGSYDEFVLTAMSNQNNNSGFINKSQKERKDLLAQFLNMGVFEKLHKIASDEIKELSGLVKDYKKQNFTEKLAQANVDYNQSVKSLKSIKSELTTLKSERGVLSETIENLLSDIKPIDSHEIDIDTLNKTKVELSKNLKVKISELKNHNDNISDYRNTLNKLKTQYDNIDLVELKEKYTKHQHYSEILNNIQIEIKELESNLNHKKSHLDGIGSLSFDDNCKHCVDNKNTPFAKQANNLEKEIRHISLKLLTLSGEFDNVEDEVNKYDVIDKLNNVKEIKESIINLENNIEKLNLKTNSCSLEIDNIKNSLNNIDNSIDTWLKNKEYIENNNTLKEQIDEKRILLSEMDDDISEKNQSIIEISSDMSVSRNTISNITSSISKLEHMEKKYKGYETYISCVKRDGIPYKLISSILPKIEVQINNILDTLVDFKILLNTDGKNINSYISYDNDKFWPLELTSGMEKFISSVAIRTALINISNLPRPNFIAIDEGFGSLDSDNFNSLYLLFDYLKTQFDFIITISHIDKTRDMVDKIIDINKIDGFSHIRYL